jgi:hypothetical protein
MEKTPHFVIKLCHIDNIGLLIPVKIDGKDKIKFSCTFESFLTSEILSVLFYPNSAFPPITSAKPAIRSIGCAMTAGQGADCRIANLRQMELFCRGFQSQLDERQISSS